MFTRFLALLCAIIAVALADEEYIPIITRQAGRAPCGRRCRFIFCSGRQVNRFLAPNRVSTPLICRLNQDISAILETGENLVVPRGGRPIRISRWRPKGLRRRFKKKFFKPLPVRGQENYGLGRSIPRENQNDFTDDQCFIVPILKYEKVHPDGSVRVVKTSNPKRDCLAFVARTEKIQIEVQWNTGDDLDLLVVEPDGTVLDNGNDRTRCGVFGFDSGIDACGIREEGAEKIFYDPNCAAFQRGQYKAVLRQASSCRNLQARWEIRLVVDGRIVQRKRGTTTGDDEGEQVGFMNFRL